MSYPRNPRKNKEKRNADGNLQNRQRDEDETLPVQQEGDGASEENGN
tara:strand:+ start:60 stop:200 length:141 start_codon:yes stop_codon:yes gene_type:complete